MDDFIGVRVFEGRGLQQPPGFFLSLKEKYLLF